MSLLTRSGIKLKIIITFSIIMLILIITMARISYMFVRNIYLEQVHENINDITRLIALDLDKKYLNFISNNSDNLASSYYKQELVVFTKRLNLDNAFIFNDRLQVFISVKPGISDTRLQINRTEIRNLEKSSSTSTVPFKGEDGNWYLWAFHRLNDKLILGVQEGVDRFARLDQLSQTFTMIGIAAFVLTIISGWFLAGTIAGPIQRLVKFSEKIGAGNFEAEVPQNIGGELQVLQDALVRMQNDLSLIQKEREKMLAQVAHEIRNPLGGIELLTGLIKEEVSPESKNAVYTSKILDEIDLLKNQINAYLSFSRPIEAQAEVIALRPLIETLNRDFSKRIAEKQLTLETNIKADQISFDPNHIRQILNNLIANSIQAVDMDGKIIVNTFEDNKKLVIEISDDGPGIADEIINNIFDPFFTTYEQGTGLGLSICKKLCHENLADISVANNADRGCTFTVSKNHNN